MTADGSHRRRIEVRGTVQGVGFRPFVHRLATRHGLGGWVRNRSGDVEIEVEGAWDALDRFVAALRHEAPPLARIEAVGVRDGPSVGASRFEILPSLTEPGASQPVPADTAACDECLRELLDPRDRRYRYPFVTCASCGPRFTIIEALPYDRAATTMRRFDLCQACAREYHDPADRRFHAEPIACPACGPRLAFEEEGRPAPGDPLVEATDRLRRGRILAIKGQGGFHLACDASDEAAVARLRKRKRRGAKPFAVMFPGLESVRTLCEMTRAEAERLGSPGRPILLLRRLHGGPEGSAPLAPSVSPGLTELGAMLPSTPLHHLLLQDFGGPLVMTSGNLAEEPIAAANEEARVRLAHVADGFLVHDRPIASRYDDSVARVVDGAEIVVRRARGYAPSPLTLPFAARRDVLACGAQLKSAVCLLKGRHAYLSQHIGDLESLETLEHFEATVALYQRLFGVRPTVVAHDLHPDYLSTRFALGLPGVERIAVQHHHAHVVSCMVEHGLEGPVIGVAYDGTGYGPGGGLWGGEVLVADRARFERRAHLREAPMPGGEAAIRKPYRMALGYLLAWFPDDLEPFAPFLERLDAREVTLARAQVERGLNTPLTSSCGRLFDAVSALLGVCEVARYEAQAAMELEAAADPSVSGVYPYDVRRTDGGVRMVDPAPLLRAACLDRLAGVPIPTIAMRVHRTVADFTAEVCRELVAETGLDRVVLSGGVFQNTRLLTGLVGQLRAAGLSVWFNQRVPTNDGGLSLGQAVIAHCLTEVRSV